MKPGKSKKFTVSGLGLPSHHGAWRLGYVIVFRAQSLGFPKM